MTSVNPIALPATAALSFKLAYDIEDGWDFLWAQISTDGVAWITLTNANTSSSHDPGWIGGSYGFPDDLASAGIGGFTGGRLYYSDEVFNLSAFAGSSARLRFWYMTDWGTLGAGPFIDDILVSSGSTTTFYDNAESGDGNWSYAAPWTRNSGCQSFTHAYYLQWRNVATNGGYDSSLGDARWRFGPANSGLLVWYNNDFYTDNEVFNYLNDYPGFGPKGRMLVVDAHPEPYRDPYWVAAGYSNEGANVSHRSLMRDAPFSLDPSVGFTMQAGYVADTNTYFAGRPAVSMFSDSMGWYPGAEHVVRAPSNATTWIWCTKQWDASAVLPSTMHYGINAPGYTNPTPFRFDASRTGDGRLSAYWYSSGLGYDGSAGNPGDVGGAYGWYVQILDQSPTQATLLIGTGVPEPACAALIMLALCATWRARRAS